MSNIELWIVELKKDEADFEADVGSPMKKLCLDTERIVYRFYLGESMVTLAGCYS